VISVIILALAGLASIVAGWMVQAICSLKGDHEIKLGFLVFYMLGAALLVADGIFAGDVELPILNLLSLAGAGVVLVNVLPETRQNRPRKRGK
jgi:hypothetical protein